jgi:hypothetical protein
MTKRTAESHLVERDGKLLEIQYDPRWLPANPYGEDLALITCRSIFPKTNAPLSIAPNGFYQHTLATSIVTAAGGPIDYIDVMLSAEGE